MTKKWYFFASLTTSSKNGFSTTAPEGLCG